MQHNLLVMKYYCLIFTLFLSTFLANDKFKDNQEDSHFIDGNENDPFEESEDNEVTEDAVDINTDSTYEILSSQGDAIDKTENNKKEIKKIEKLIEEDLLVIDVNDQMFNTEIPKAEVENNHIPSHGQINNAVEGYSETPEEYKDEHSDDDSEDELDRDIYDTYDYKENLLEDVEQEAYQPGEFLLAEEIIPKEALKSVKLLTPEELSEIEKEIENIISDYNFINDDEEADNNRININSNNNRPYIPAEPISHQPYMNDEIIIEEFDQNTDNETTQNE